MTGFLLIALSSFGCTGAIVSPGRAGDDGTPGSGVSAGGAGSDTANPGSSTSAEADGVNSVRRLTRLEYDNSIFDLLGDSTAPASALPADPNDETGFETPIPVGPTEAGNLRDLADGVAQRAVGNLNTVVACDPGAMGEDACATQFIARFGRRAFRRPLLPEEQSDLESLYTATKTTLAYAWIDRIRVLISAMLQSPPFLYRWEIGNETLQTVGGRVRLTPYQMASRLSYFFWRTTPDEALLAAADSGALVTAEQVTAQAKRLMASPRANPAIGDLFAQLLALAKLVDETKDPTLFPGFTPDVRTAALNETTDFVANVFYQTRGTIGDLLSSRSASMAEGLMKLYGVKPLDDHGTVEAIQLPSQQRAGILTRVAFLAANGGPSESAPVVRGRKVREKFLCQPIPPPPPNVNTVLPVVTGSTQRQRLEVHQVTPGCSGCHLSMDPPGFAFEMFDAIGQFRTKDNAGLPVDSSGDLLNIDGGSVTFSDGVDLSGKLATSDEVRRCLAKQILRFGAGRLEAASDDNNISMALDAGKPGGYVLQDLVVGLVTSSSFQERVPSNGEALTP